MEISINYDVDFYQDYDFGTKSIRVFLETKSNKIWFDVNQICEELNLREEDIKETIKETDTKDKCLVPSSFYYFDYALMINKNALKNIVRNNSKNLEIDKFNKWIDDIENMMSHH